MVTSVFRALLHVMHWRLLVAVLVIMATADAALTRQDRKRLISVHRKLRRASALSPQPCTELNKLEWHGRLAIVAQARASKCVLKSKGRRAEQVNSTQSARPHYRVGELSVLTKLRSPPVSLAAKIRELYHEDRQHYNYTAGNCNKSKGCQHYTQLVWNASVFFGCGSHVCRQVSLSEKEKNNVVAWNVLLLVCYYALGEDLSSRGKPYQTCEPTLRSDNDMEGRPSTVYHNSNAHLSKMSLSTEPAEAPFQTSILPAISQPTLLPNQPMTTTENFMARNLGAALTTGQNRGTEQPVERSPIVHTITPVSSNQEPRRTCSHVPSHLCILNKVKACRREKECFRRGSLYHFSVGGRLRVLPFPGSKQCASDGYQYPTRCLLFSAICQGKVNHCVRKVRRRCCSTRSPTPKPTPSQELWEKFKSAAVATAVPGTCDGHSGNTDYCEKMSRGLCGTWWLTCLLPKGSRASSPVTVSLGEVCTSDCILHAARCHALRHICLRDRCARIVPRFCCSRK